MAETLNSERVEKTFLDCLFKGSEDTSTHIRAEGVITNVGFHPERLESYRPAIEEMLSELPNEFQQSGGGGWSFLNACNDRHGNQWTDLHRTIEHLILLGIAIGKVKLQLPRAVWKALPGGVPYFVVS